MQHKWRKLISYYKPYKVMFFLDILFAVTGASVSLILPLIIRYITSKVIYFDTAIVFSTIVKLALLMVGLVIVEGLCNMFITYNGHVMGAKIEANMRAEIFAHFQKLSFSFYDNQKVGQLLSRVTSDLFEISELLHHGPEDIVISIMKIAGSLYILFHINVRMSVVVLIFIPVILVYAIYFNRKMKKAFKKNRERIADINSQIEDNLSGIRVVKSFANEEIELKKFGTGNSRFVDSKKDSYRYMGGYHSGLNALISLISVSVIISGAFFMVNGSVNTTDLITFLLYITNFTDPIKKLIDFTEQFQNGYTGYERFLEILNIEPDIKDKKNAIAVKSLKGDIRFENVSFAYEENAQKVLSHIDLQVKAGEYIAIVGSSGAGKTTLLSLLPRFYDVSDGRIMIDQIDIRNMKLKDLRDNIGIVQQDVYLFAGTVMDNIRYGRPDATDREVVEAARRANAHGFIAELPDVYNTDIGQRGIKLSGGQKQRLAIARVFLKNPPILIFDEATSALDNESEKVVQMSLEELAKNRTTFVIAHRLSTIRNAEKIIVLSEDGIEETGTHDELLAANGLYQHLYTMQFERKDNM